MLYFVRYFKEQCPNKKKINVKKTYSDIVSKEEMKPQC